MKKDEKVANKIKNTVLEKVNKFLFSYDIKLDSFAQDQLENYKFTSKTQIVAYNDKICITDFDGDWQNELQINKNGKASGSFGYGVF